MEDELKAYYRQSLSSRIDALDAALQSWMNNDRSMEESIRRIAHSLRGSGATYGFPEVSKTAQIAEEARPEELADSIKTLLDLLRKISTGKKTNRYNILIIEDDPDIYRLLEIVLSGENRQIFIAETAAEAEKIIEQNEISFIALDLVLPDVDGRNFLVTLRERPKTSATPLYVISGLPGDHIKTECLALGANAFFKKPFDPRSLAASIAVDIQRGDLERQPPRDPITGLPNRAALREAYAQAVQKDEPCSIAVLDLKPLRALPEKLAEEECDRFIARTASIIDRQLRKTDVMTRWGEKELAVLFPNTAPNAAAELLTIARQTLQQETFQCPSGQQIQVTFSAGVVSASKSLTVDEAAANADRLLFLAKTEGQNLILSEESITPIAKNKILLAEDDGLVASIVKHRLGREGFDIVHCEDGEAALAEASKSPFSLVILDVKMPVMDGFEVLANLRKIVNYEKTPIVMLTSMGSEKDITRGFSLGANDYILKPFSPVELIARVRRLLKG